jgi:hypothetical protein
MTRPLDLAETIVALHTWPNRRARLAARAWIRRLPVGVARDALADTLAEAPRLVPARAD